MKQFLSFTCQNVKWMSAVNEKVMAGQLISWIFHCNFLTSISSWLYWIEPQDHNPHHRNRDYADDEGSGYGDDDDDYYYEEDITEMPPSVKMDEDVEVKDVEKPRKVGDIA